jgi:hypothetical protein
MKRWLSYSSVQIALCVGLYTLIAFSMGATAAVFAAAPFALILGRLLFYGVVNYRRSVLEQVWLPVHGRHYVFMGQSIHVQEDEDQCRWLSLLDVQKIVGVTASERALMIAYPGRLKLLGDRRQMHIRDDALVAHLGKENTSPALRFRTWVERNIALPGRTTRKRLGISAETEMPH